MTKNNASQLLIDDYPLQVLPKLAKVVGLEEALILQQVHYWLNRGQGDEADGERWIYNTYQQWQAQFPFWSIQQIGRFIRSLEEQGLLISGSYNKTRADRTKWYRVNYPLLNDLNSKLNTLDNSAANDHSSELNALLYTETTPETTPETTNVRAQKQSKTLPILKVSEEYALQLIKDYSFAWSEAEVRERIEEAENFYAPKMLKGQYASIEICVRGSLRRNSGGVTKNSSSLGQNIQDVNKYYQGHYGEIVKARQERRTQ